MENTGSIIMPIVIKGKQGIAHNRFILYWLNFSDIRKYITGSTRTKLNLENLKKYHFQKFLFQSSKKSLIYLLQSMTS